MIPLLLRRLLGMIGESLVIHRRSLGLLSRAFPWTVTGIIVLAISAAIVPFVLTGSIAFLIDQIIAGIDEKSYATIGLGVLLVIVSSTFPEVIGIIREFCDRFLWLRGSAYLQLLYARHRFDVDIAYYEHPKFHDMLQKIEERGVWPILNLFEYQIANVTNMVAVVISTAILLFVDWRLLVILIMGSVPRLIVGIRYGNNVWSIYDASAEERRKFSRLRELVDHLTALMEMRIHHSASFLLRKLSGLLTTFTDAQIGIERKKFFWGVCALALSVAAVVLVYWIVIRSAFIGVISIGMVLFLFTSIREFQSSFERFFSGLGRMYEWEPFVREFLRFFDLTITRKVSIHQKAVTTLVAPEIVFEDVRFRYPGSTSLVLDGVSFTIPAGKTVALVGTNGAGKSTIVKLIARFFDPSSGRILINGTDLREIDLDSWYKTIGVLFQEFPTFKGMSVAEAIAMGEPTNVLDRARVRDAARRSQAEEFIAMWPLGYDEIVGKEFTSGTDLSHGQEQRLALARIFYRSPKFLILDEPTAAIDAEAEQNVFEEFMKMNGQTRLLISHRFSSVRKADRILVLGNGRIIEEGNHRELLDKNGVYARLFYIQAMGYRDE